MKILLFLLATPLLLLLGITTVVGSGSHYISDATYAMDDVNDITVAFNNRLPQDGNFTIHCNSREDDLGAHLIAPSNYYEFSFEVNFFQTTYYFCNLRWRDVAAAFYSYRASRDMGRCRHYCLWNVKEEGIQGFREGDGSQPDIIVSWK